MTSRALTAGLGALYVAASAIAPLILKTAPSDLDLYFWPSAETVVAGHPLLIYAAGLHHLYANDNGPLGLAPLVPMAALANAFGWAGSLTGRAALSGAVTSLFALLLAYQAVGFTAAARGDARRPLAVAATVVLAPALWIAVLDYGHVEQPVEVCLVLFAVTCALRKRNVLSGVALGASILTRTIAGFCAIPLLLVVFAARGGRAAVNLAAAALVTIVVGILPFVLGDEQAVVHSLLTYRDGLPIAGGSFWIVAREASWSGILQWGDVYVGAAVAITLVAITVWRRPAVATTHAGVIGARHHCVVLPASVRENRVPVLPFRALRVFRPVVAGSSRDRTQLARAGAAVAHHRRLRRDGGADRPFHLCGSGRKRSRIDRAGSCRRAGDRRRAPGSGSCSGCTLDA